MSDTYKDRNDINDNIEAYEEEQKAKYECKELLPNRWWEDELEPSLWNGRAYL